MKARPILFSAPMIRALLASTKTQTRRVVKPQPWGNGFIASTGEILTDNDYLPPDAMLLTVGKGRDSYTTSSYEGWESACPYGVPNDLLWVRESFGRHYSIPEFRGWVADDWRPTMDHERTAPSIHMPRAWSRLTLHITDVRVQRLQEISEDDAKAEGAAFTCPQCGNDLDDEHGAEVHAACDDDAGSYHDGFRRLWKSINGAGSWDANPWVWALTFEIIKQNVDAVLASRIAA